MSRWTPHPSHLAWETIEGERYCRVCGTGDTDAWPLCESPCSATTPTRVLESREQMTRDDLREAIRYREGGASWLAVGQILGRNHHAVQRAVEAYQAGRGRVAKRERGAA